ncbi:MAG: hypothetical protein ABI148_00015 [Ginsengibacter sp.]
MRKNFINKTLLKKEFLFIFLLPIFFSCENHHFDSDKRQIISKDEIQNKLHRARAFDVTHFKEDTVEIENDSNFKKQIRYSLDIEYLDSNKVLQKKEGIVMFAPDGQSVINSKITDR